MPTFQGLKSFPCRFGIRILMVSMIVVSAFFAGRTSMPEPSHDLSYVPGAVAIAGRPDLDGDGKPDLSKLMKIISEAGGEVVAIENANGEVCGEINRYTRYLIVPDKPSNLTKPNKLVALAKKNEVEILTSRNFFRRAGVHFHSVLPLDNRIEPKTHSAFETR